MSKTKPDWSDEEKLLWIELKYVRKVYGLRQITEDIAADITKYGGNGRHVLFVVYDLERLIVNEAAFAEPVARHGGMMVRVHSLNAAFRPPSGPF